MPYRQLDVNRSYATSDRQRRLPNTLSETYANVMSVKMRCVHIAIRPAEGAARRTVDVKTVGTADVDVRLSTGLQW
jgi:hypothetical protein